MGRGGIDRVASSQPSMIVSIISAPHNHSISETEMLEAVSRHHMTYQQDRSSADMYENDCHLQERSCKPISIPPDRFMHVVYSDLDYKAFLIIRDLDLEHAAYATPNIHPCPIHSRPHRPPTSPDQFSSKQSFTTTPAHLPRALRQHDALSHFLRLHQPGRLLHRTNPTRAKHAIPLQPNLHILVF